MSCVVAVNVLLIVGFVLAAVVVAIVFLPSCGGREGREVCEGREEGGGRGEGEVCVCVCEGAYMYVKVYEHMMYTNTCTISYSLKLHVHVQCIYCRREKVN